MEVQEWLLEQGITFELGDIESTAAAGRYDIVRWILSKAFMHVVLENDHLVGLAVKDVSWARDCLACSPASHGTRTSAPR